MPKKSQTLENEIENIVSHTIGFFWAIGSGLAFLEGSDLPAGGVRGRLGEKLPPVARSG